jgi:hypothetical protein
MSKLKALLVGAFFILSAPVVADEATYRITESPGGALTTFMQKYTLLADEETRIVIDGDCVSACTLFLGLVPKERVCVTDKARLGFHSATVRITVGRVVTFRYSAEATSMLYAIYPDNVHRYLRKRGWDGLSAHPDLIYVSGKALAKLVQPCKDTQ